MNQKLIKFQGLLVALLSMILLAEWGYGRFSSGKLLELQSIENENTDLPIELPVIAGLKTAGPDYNEVVERPLFIEGRRPIVETPEVVVPQVDVGQIDDWALIGIYKKDDKQMALFSKKNEAKKYQKMTVGQLISGCTLNEIQSDRVILMQNGQPKTVLLRKPRADAPANAGKPGQPKPPKAARPPNNPLAPPPPPNPNPENANDDIKN